MKISAKIPAVFFGLVLSLIVCLPVFGEEIIVCGDSQHNPEVQRKLVRAMLSFKPAIVFRVGDIVDNGNDQSLWQSFNDIHGELVKTTEYFPALGNHENDSPLYFENFRFLQNRHWYSVDRGGIHFVILDSNSRLDLGSLQYKWLRSDLAKLDSAIKFIIVIFHHPLFDVSAVHQSDEKRLKSALLPLFKYYRVSAVFSGHAHDYQRFEYQGMNFIVTGGGGSNLYKQLRENPHLKRFSLAYHFCLLSPGDNFLRVRVIGVNSDIIDEFKIPGRGQFSGDK